MTIFLLVFAVALTGLMLLKSEMLRSRDKKEIEDLNTTIRRLRADCDEATARAEKYEEDFQKELNRISILLNKMI